MGKNQKNQDELEDAVVERKHCKYFSISLK